jgi:hypothetical protein
MLGTVWRELRAELMDAPSSSRSFEDSTARTYDVTPSIRH